VRLDRLVGGDEHEALDARVAGDLGQRAGGERVVAHRLERIQLHQRHVLEGRRVEHDLRPVLLEQRAHLLAVAGVGEHRHAVLEAAILPQLSVDLEQRVLAALHQYQLLGSDAGDLTAQLRADRAAGAGDDNGLPCEVAGDPLEVDLHLLAPEHVLDLNGPDLSGQLAREELVKSR